MADRLPVERFANIDAYRTMAILLVISLHANFIGRLHELGHGHFLVDVTLYQIWWISVPYFFLAAGYFFGKRVQSGQDPLALLSAYSLPLLRVFAISLFLYSLIPRDWIRLFARNGIIETVSTQAVASLSRLANEHIRLLLIPQPPVFHLWFLPALIIGLAAGGGGARLPVGEMGGHTYLCALWSLRARRNPRSTFPSVLRFAAVVYVGAVCVARMADVGPFNSFLPLGLVIGGYVLAVIEAAVIAKGFHGSAAAVRDHSYAGAIIMVAGLFLLTLTAPPVGRGIPFSFMAKSVLGIYVSHILVLYTFEPLLVEPARLSAVGHLAFVVAVYATSLGLTFALSHTPILRYAVTRECSVPQSVKLRGPALSSL